MIKVYDMMTKIHGETADNIEKFDEMLNQYGVDHVFMLPTCKQIDEDETIEGNVLYMEEDAMTFSLAAMLFCKTVLNKSDDKIINTMRKMVNKKLSEA